MVMGRILLASRVPSWRGKILPCLRAWRGKILPSSFTTAHFARRQQQHHTKKGQHNKETMSGFGMRPGIILLREGTDTSQVSSRLRVSIREGSGREARGMVCFFAPGPKILDSGQDASSRHY